MSQKAHALPFLSRSQFGMMALWNITVLGRRIRFSRTSFSPKGAPNMIIKRPNDSMGKVYDKAERYKIRACAAQKYQTQTYKSAVTHTKTPTQFSTMKFSSIFFAPLILLATSVAAVPTPDADVSSIDAKNALIVSAGDLSAARAAVTGTVNADNVRYRRCANTDCEAIGQYHTGRKITIQCRVRGETIRGWP